MEQRFGWCALQRKVGSVETMTPERSLVRMQRPPSGGLFVLRPSHRHERLVFRAGNGIAGTAAALGLKAKK